MDLLKVSKQYFSKHVQFNLLKASHNISPKNQENPQNLENLENPKNGGPYSSGPDLPAWARRTKWRGPKGLQLEVGAQRAPRLLLSVGYESKLIP